MATTKKATEAAEASETVQANISPADTEKAVNEASENPTEAQEAGPLYSVEEYARVAGKVFAKPYSPDIVRAAFAVSGKKEATKAEAEEIVKKFANKEVKD